MTTFCKALTSAASFRITGDNGTMTFNPCCVYDGDIPFHSTLFKRNRKIFAEATTFLPGCHRCELKERTHGYSQRTMFNRELEVDESNITKLEIVIDTTCNAACIQCGVSQSSLWRKEVAYPNRVIHIQPEQQIANYVEQIKKDIDLTKVKTFHFWGGEPLLTDTHLQFLNEVSNPEEVSISYSTNMSIMPDDELLKLWEKFKNIRIHASVDGVGDKFDYIRWPISWEKASRNMISLRENSLSNMDLGINHCVLPLNVFYIDELGEWLDKNFSRANNGTEIPYAFIRGEGTLDIAKTPLLLREAVWKKYGEEHTASKILKEVPEDTNISSMIYHLDEIDARRNQSWQNTFKEVAGYFK